MRSVFRATPAAELYLPKVCELDRGDGETYFVRRIRYLVTQSASQGLLEKC